MIERGRQRLRDIDRWSYAHRAPRVARRAVTGFLAHDALQFAGSMAYFGVLSIFQLLVLAVVVGTYVLGEDAARRFVIDQVSGGSPLDPDMVGAILDATIESRGQVTLISGAFLLWSALGVFSALSGGIARAFESAAPRPFVQDKLLGLLLMALTGVLAVGSLVIGLVTGIVQQAADDPVGRAAPGQQLLLSAIGLVVPFILIFIAFWLVYRLAPTRTVSLGEVWPGALAAAVLWTILRLGFTWYATSVARYDTAFGPISTGITLLVFLYFASLIVLFGAEVARANVIDRERVATWEADPRFLPVPTGLGSLEAEHRVAPRRRGPSRWVLVAGAALAGLVAGRLSKRDEDE